MTNMNGAQILWAMQALLDMIEPAPKDTAQKRPGVVRSRRHIKPYIWLFSMFAELVSSFTK